MNPTQDDANVPPMVSFSRYQPQGVRRSTAGRPTIFADDDRTFRDYDGLMLLPPSTIAYVDECDQEYGDSDNTDNDNDTTNKPQEFAVCHNDYSYGKQQQGSKNMNDVMVDIDIIDDTECSESYEIRGNDPKRRFCYQVLFVVGWTMVIVLGAVIVLQSRHHSSPTSNRAAGVVAATTLANQTTTTTAAPMVAPTAHSATAGHNPHPVAVVTGAPIAAASPSLAPVQMPQQHSQPQHANPKQGSDDKNDGTAPEQQGIDFDVRINSGSKQPYLDLNQREWLPDDDPSSMAGIFTVSGNGGVQATDGGTSSAQGNNNHHHYDNTNNLQNVGVEGTGLYSDERFFVHRGVYNVVVPRNHALYQVDLFFAELYYAQAGQRVFDVIMEGQVVERDYDIFVRAGNHNATASRIGRSIYVADGALTIELVSKIEYAKISGIRVRNIVE
jgi:Malectin domain